MATSQSPSEEEDAAPSRRETERKPTKEEDRFTVHHHTTFTSISWDCSSGEGMEEKEATAARGVAL
jgi:hypothetical protein